jgi:hypothetical protein
MAHGIREGTHAKILPRPSGLAAPSLAINKLPNIRGVEATKAPSGSRMEHVNLGSKLTNEALGR